MSAVCRRTQRSRCSRHEPRRSSRRRSRSRRVESTFPLSASQLGVEPDWEKRSPRRPPTAAASARSAASGGSGRVSSASSARRPVGLRRRRRLQARSDRPAVDRAGRRKARAHGASTCRWSRAEPVWQLDRAAAAAAVVADARGDSTAARLSLFRSLQRAEVKGVDLAEAAAQARTALSAPLRSAYGETRWRVPRWRIAPLFQLPAGGATTVSIAGRPAEEYLERLSAAVSRKPQDARFQVTATGKIVDQAIRRPGSSSTSRRPRRRSRQQRSRRPAHRQARRTRRGAHSARRRSRRRWGSRVSSRRTRRRTAARRATQQRSARRAS